MTWNRNLIFQELYLEKPLELPDWNLSCLRRITADHRFSVCLYSIVTLGKLQRAHTTAYLGSISLSMGIDKQSGHLPMSNMNEDFLQNTHGKSIFGLCRNFLKLNSILPKNNHHKNGRKGSIILTTLSNSFKNMKLKSLEHA